MEIDDDHFEYEGGMQQCISGFGRNTKECIEQLQHNPNSDAANRSLTWHVDELVRWCRGLNRERRLLEAKCKVLRDELVGCGNGFCDDTINDAFERAGIVDC